MTLITLASGRSINVEKHERRGSAAYRLPHIPVICLHGILNTMKTFSPLVPLLPHHTFILVDLQGHGQTPSYDCPLLPAMLAADINDILTYFGFSRATLLAHSAGALIALQFAQDYPTKTHRLVLMCPLGIPVSPEAQLGNAHAIRTMDLSAMVAYVSSWVGSKARDNEHVLALIKSETELSNREGVASVVEGLAQFVYKDDEAADTVVIWAREDTIADAKAADSVVKLTHAKEIVLDMGHYITWEDVTTTAEVLREIL